MEDVTLLARVLKVHINNIEGEVELLKCALGNTSTHTKMSPSKIKVPELKSFRGLRNAKELENFLWDIE